MIDRKYHANTLIKQKFSPLMATSKKKQLMEDLYSTARLPKSGNDTPLLIIF